NRNRERTPVRTTPVSPIAIIFLPAWTRQYWCTRGLTDSTTLWVLRLRQESTGMTAFDLCHLFRCTRGNNLATTRSALWSQINKPVSAFNDIQIMFDGNHRIAFFHQPIEHHQKFADVFEVQPCSGLIQ